MAQAGELGPTRDAGWAREPGLTREAERHRLATLVKVAASSGDFSPKLSRAVERATDEEVRVMADLLERGMSIPKLVNVLQGAHVLVGDESLYQGWIFPISRRRLSSHHRTIDKATTPDYGLDGPLVREALHGRTSTGTWVQLERTKATFQWGKLPRWHDLVHIRDYVVYRVTGKNVGPWGLSAHVDTRPIILRPSETVASRGADRALGTLARHRSTGPQEGPGQPWGDMLSPEVEPVGPAGDLFSPPAADDPAELLPALAYAPDLGGGLFGELPLLTFTTPLTLGVLRTLALPEAAAGLDPPTGVGEPVSVSVGNRKVKILGHVLPPVHVRTVFIGIEEEL